MLHTYASASISTKQLLQRASVDDRDDAILVFDSDQDDHDHACDSESVPGTEDDEVLISDSESSVSDPEQGRGAGATSTDVDAGRAGSTVQAPPPVPVPVALPPAPRPRRCIDKATVACQLADGNIVGNKRRKCDDCIAERARQRCTRFREKHDGSKPCRLHAPPTSKKGSPLLRKDCALCKADHRQYHYENKARRPPPQLPPLSLPYIPLQSTSSRLTTMQLPVAPAMAESFPAVDPIATREELQHLVAKQLQTAAAQGDLLEITTFVDGVGNVQSRQYVFKTALYRESTSTSSQPAFIPRPIMTAAERAAAHARYGASVINNRMLHQQLLKQEAEQRAKSKQALQLFASTVRRDQGGTGTICMATIPGDGTPIFQY